MNIRGSFKIARSAGHSLIGTVLGVVLLLNVATLAQSQNGQGGGNVQPPNAKPQGHSLEGMAKLLALFDTSNNNPIYYPKTPFQILFGNPNITTVTPKACPQ